MMKKVGVLTFHCQYNFGSALQAYALQKAIERLNIECLILNFYYEEDMKKNYDIRWSSKRMSVIILDLLTWYNNHKRKRAFKEFHSKYLNFSRQTKDWHELEIISRDCEYLICGSDQIWNPAIVHTLAYFLPFANSNQKKISYAPSIALSSIPEDSEFLFCQYLKDFSCLSIRESNCISQLSTLVGKKVECVLDPTMLLQKEDYDLMVDNYKIILPSDYIFVYCLHLSDLKRLSSIALKLAEKENLQIVYFNKFSLNYKKRFAKNIFDYDPRAFVYTIKNAKYVVSNSFHACVFSILYNKQFYSVQVPDSQSRLDTLFISLGIEGRVVSEDNFNNVSAIDYDYVSKKLSAKRAESWNFLKKALDYGD